MTRADEQLMRLLRAFPLMASEPHLTVAMLAERIGSDEETLSDDLRALERSDVPAAWVDAVRVYIESAGVSLHSAHFKRPLRLLRPELAAVELGLSLLAQELPEAERSAIAALRRKLDDLGVPITETVVDRRRGADESKADHTERAVRVEAVSQDRLSLLAQVQRATDMHCVLALHYQRADDRAASARRVRPYALVRKDAHVYLAGYCETAQALRVFRMDRMHDAQGTDDTFEVPADFSVEAVLQQGHVFQQETPATETLVIRYSSAVARWITSREKSAIVHADGSATMHYPLADSAWAVRHVLQYGPDAVIVSPVALQAEVGATLQRMRG